MKRCPQCSHVYTDDLSFCLSDGTPLIGLLEDQDRPTVVRSGDRSAAASQTGSGLWLKVLAVLAVLFFGFLVLAGIAAWVFWPVPTVSNTNNNIGSNLASVTPTPVSTATPLPSPSPTIASSTDINADDLKRQQDELDRERKRLEEERRRLEEEKQRPPATPRPPPRFNDPGTTRITFRRGSVGHTVSSTVARQRSFVLRTLNGQYLSASVSSPGGCVTFRGGGSSTGFATRQGDSFLYLTNNCSDPSRFRLSVTVR